MIAAPGASERPPGGSERPFGRPHADVKTRPLSASPVDPLRPFASLDAAGAAGLGTPPPPDIRLRGDGTHAQALFGKRPDLF